MSVASAELEVTSPYDGTVVDSVAISSSDDVAAALRRAERARSVAFPAWRRAEVLFRAAELLADSHREAAETIVKEAGKPLKQALVEAGRAAETLRLAAIEATKLSGEVVPLAGAKGHEGKVGYTVRVPLGIVAAITPYNFPLNLVAHKVGPALAAGNSVVLKPASQTPLSAIGLTRIFAHAGLPEGFLEIVIGSGSTVGRRLIEDPRVAAVSFTGSREIGWGIAEAAARKRVSLELGSTSPAIVCADGNWDAAARLIAQHGFSYAGQSCISVQRVLVESEIGSAFVGRLMEAVARLEVGDPASGATDIGPLIDDDSRARVTTWIDAARREGATVQAGGEVNPDGTVQPTVLTGVAAKSRVWTDEVFGPVVSIRRFTRFEDAIAQANESDYGLQAGVFTRDLGRAMQATEELDFGGVLINDVPTVRADLQPYGGVRDSGRGREGPAWAVRELTEERFVSWRAL